MPYTSPPHFFPAFTVLALTMTNKDTKFINPKDVIRTQDGKIDLCTSTDPYDTHTLSFSFHC